MFVVEGGVYTDNSFSKLVEGKEESYGPFATHDEAFEVWQGRARANIDNCCHRLAIKKQ